MIWLFFPFNSGCVNIQCNFSNSHLYMFLKSWYLMIHCSYQKYVRVWCYSQQLKVSTVWVATTATFWQFPKYNWVCLIRYDRQYPGVISIWQSLIEEIGGITCNLINASTFVHLINQNKEMFKPSFKCPFVLWQWTNKTNSGIEIMTERPIFKLKVMRHDNILLQVLVLTFQTNVYPWKKYLYI